MLQKPFIWIVK